jgi:hypothetical protein
MSQPPAEVIAANAEKIARVLNLRLSPKRLAGAARDRVMGALLQARGGDLSNLDAELDAAAATIEPAVQRAYALCRLLLEGTFLVPAGSALEDRLAWRLRGSFLQCRADDPDRFASLREEFISCQRSSLPAVRRLVGDALADEPIDDPEVGLLRDDRQPHDARCRICVRVLGAGQYPHFLDVFDYYVKAVREADRRGSGDHPAAESVRKLTQLLNSPLRRSQEVRKEVMMHLFPKYIEHARDPVVSGKLMTLLREYGDWLVQELTGLFRESPAPPGQRAAIAKLLGHMAQHKLNAKAVEALALLLGEVRGDGAMDLAEFFTRAAQGVAAREPTADSGAVRRAFQEALDRFDATTDPVLRLMAKDLRELPWGEGLRPEIIRSYLAGNVDEKQAYLIRFCGSEGLGILAEAAADRGRPPDQRRRALEKLGELRNPRLHTQVSEVAWRAYLDDPDPSVRGTALRVVVGRRRKLSEADQEQLIRDYQAAPPGPLRTAFQEHRSYLIPPGILEVRHEPPETETP